MPSLPNWNLSQQSRARLAELLASASDLGLNPDAVAAGGLAALQALIALKRAKDAAEGAGRDALIIRVQDALRRLDPTVHGDLLQQVQARIVALQGRGGDTEIVHVALGEIVLPKTLQTPVVLGALRQAAGAANIPFDQLRIGSPLNRINPETGKAEFYDASLDEKDIAQGGAEGMLARDALVGIKTGQVRSAYADKVHALDPYDNAGREALKDEYRPQTPAETRASIADARKGPRDGSIGRANVTNPKVDELARWAGRAGRGVGVLGAGMAAYDIANAEDSARAAVANSTSMVGGMLGGAAGAALGAATGPAAPFIAPSTGLAGSVAGGSVGYKAGEELYDLFHRKPR